MRLVESNKVDNNIIDNLIKSDIKEAFNPENEEKNKIIRQALKGPKNYEKNKEELKKMGISSGRREEYDSYEPGETIYLHGPNGKHVSVDPDGTDVWRTFGSGGEHYKKELDFYNRHSKNYNNQEHLDYNGDRAKAFDYYNYLTKPNNDYQSEVDTANKAKNYRDNENKTGYNLPDNALTPEEKSLNKRPRKYLKLKQDREELEKELSGYSDVKKKLDKTNDEIKKLHEDEDIKTIQTLAKTVEAILKNSNADISYFNTSDYEGNVIEFSCKFNSDNLSNNESVNKPSLYGTLNFDENLKLIKADIKTSSGPNVLNYDFIRTLAALYTYFDSGNSHWLDI